MRLLTFLAGFLVLGALALSVLRPDIVGSGVSGKPVVVATTGHIADIVQNIAGDSVTVTALMGAGTDPHLYRPTRLDVLRLKNADLVFYNGLHLEGQMVELLETLSEEKPSVAMADNIESILDDADGVHDPHIWMDVQNWVLASELVLAELEKLLPEERDVLQGRAALYVGKLKKLDGYIRQAVTSVPEENRVLITAHDAFGYFGDAYGVEVVGIQGLSTASEAGLQRINAVVARIVEHKIPAIFVESSVSDQNVRALVAGAQAKGHDVEIGGTLYSDALGEPGTPEGTYAGMMEHNVRVLVNALGGEPPVFEYGKVGSLAAL